MLTVQDLTKRFQGRDILRRIDLNIAPGEVVGLIGHSGAGKSTLARCLVGLEHADAGAIMLSGRPVVPGRGRARQQIQYLWQDPTQSLSPYLTARGAVMEPLTGFAIDAANGRYARATALLGALGLPHALHSRHPHSLSGGQCQRVALARALAADPQVLILDEPLSSLDLATQVNTVKLLRQIHAEKAISTLIVSHDLAPLRQLVSRVLVLDKAQIIEDIPMTGFTEHATHPLSRAYAETL